MVGFELAAEDGISGDLRDRQWERVLQADWECGRPVGFGGHVHGFHSVPACTVHCRFLSPPRLTLILRFGPDPRTP